MQNLYVCKCHVRLIRLPKHVHDVAEKIGMVGKKFLHTYGRQPSTTELARSVGISEEKVSHQNLQNPWIGTAVNSS